MSDKAQVQSLQKQVKDVQNTNTTLQTERDRLSSDLQVCYKCLRYCEVYFLFCVLDNDNNNNDKEIYFTSYLTVYNNIC